MNESTKILSKKAGLPPGALIHIGRRKSNKIKLTAIDYDSVNFSETICNSTQECEIFKQSDTVSWINVDGLHDTEAIANIGKLFDLHPLLLEDVLNTRHRPKLEEFDNYLFVTLKMLGINKEGNSLVTEQISLVLGKGWVISFQEMEGDLFDNLRLRIRESKGNIRHRGADYLLYRLIDTIVDNYFFVIEHITEVTENLEERIIHTPDDKSIQEIQHLKKQLINLRKAVNPLREAITALQKDTLELIEESTSRYLRDVYEHIIHINDSIDSLRETLASLMDLYLTGISNKMNEVMKVLTIIATIFIPLTFIAGVYGMNFDHMPELHFKYGYFVIWGIMICVLIVMIFYFKRKRWL